MCNNKWCDVIVYAYRVVRHSTTGEVREYHVTFVDGRKGEIKNPLVEVMKEKE